MAGDNVAAESCPSSAFDGINDRSNGVSPLADGVFINRPNEFPTSVVERINRQHAKVAISNPEVDIKN